MVGLKQTITYSKISPRMVNPRDTAGNAAAAAAAEEEEEEEEEEKFKILILGQPVQAHTP